jgi:hypothetical protein
MHQRRPDTVRQPIQQDFRRIRRGIGLLLLLLFPDRPVLSWRSQGFATRRQETGDNNHKGQSHPSHSLIKRPLSKLRKVFDWFPKSNQTPPIVALNHQRVDTHAIKVAEKGRANEKGNEPLQQPDQGAGSSTLNSQPSTFNLCSRPFPGCHRPKPDKSDQIRPRKE